ncbi:MAG TPA: hypothetical protein VMT37_12895 [Solirubrobacterales bacterium]|nr:hypothetical protein [Solirubrobacterales bacterium]
MASRSLLAIVTDAFGGAETIAELRREAGDGADDVRVVVPAVAETQFRDLTGDVDSPAVAAAERLRATLLSLRDAGVQASGRVGDPDPLRAAQDALLEGPADEVLIFEHVSSQARWFEEGLFERVQECIEPPLRMVVVEADAAGAEHVVDVESAAAGTVDHEAAREVGSAYLPGLSRGDFAGMVTGIVGTIVVIVLAAAATAEATPTGWQAAAIMIAIVTALINMAHVVGLTLMETVRYRGGFAVFFRTLALVGTPLALVVNLLILLLA